MSGDAKPLVAYQARQRRKTVEAIEVAQRTIEAEMSEHGYYPRNGGRLSKLEVLRRAGVSAQTLKNATHRETAAALDRWLSRVKKVAPTLRPQAEDAKVRRISDLEQKLAQTMSHYDLFKLEYNEALREIEELKAQNADLRRKLGAASKVTHLKARR